jgi:D-alanine-D-alanine ligase
VEELLARREEIAASDLVIEHSDTFRGRGDLRPLVRHLIESWGGKVAGSPAAAAQVADDKLETARRLLGAGLSVPRSRILTDPRPPAGLRYPAVLKRLFEHGSRGVAVVRGSAELKRTAGRWLSRGDGSVLVQELIAGKELAASVIEAEDSPVVLPLVEIVLDRDPSYSSRKKWGSAPLPIVPAELTLKELRGVKSAAVLAFQALGLRDYARFDIRLRPDGRPCFLEANARPSVEDGTELRLSAELAGLGDHELLVLILASAARRHGREDIQRALRPLSYSVERRLRMSCP